MKANRGKRALTALARAEAWGMAGLAMMCMAWEGLLPLAAGVGVMFWLARWAARGRPTARTPGDWARLGLLLMLPVTLWATALPERTLTEALRLLVGVMLFYALVNSEPSGALADSPARAAGRMSLGLGALALGLGVFALGTVDWGAIADKLRFIPAGVSELLHGLPRLAVDMVHPNVMAGTLAMLAPAVLAKGVFSRGKQGWARRGLWGLAGLFLLGVVGLTQSRGAYLGLAAGVAVLTLLRWPKWGWAGVAGVGLLLAGAVALSGLPAVSLISGSTGTPAGSLEGRLEIWSRAGFMIRDFPLTGVGMGSFGPAADALYPFLSYPSGQVTHAHNLFLEAAVDLGLPGLICWLGALAAAMSCAWQAYRGGARGKTADPRLRELGAAALAGLTVLAVHGMVDAVTWGTRPAVLVWGLMGAAAYAWRAVNNGTTIATVLNDGTGHDLGRV